MLRTPITLALAVGAAVFMAGCAGSGPGDEPRPELRSWTFQPDMIFPADRSLARAEDGVALGDGRLLVTDQRHGLSLLEPDGSHRPFGDFAAAGYLHEPPAIVGGPNGVTLEPGGRHVLVADVFRGGLYRVEIATEATERIYQHEFGVNMARRDRRGGIWFTQSTRNRPEHGEAELFESVGIPNPDGAIFYLAFGFGEERNAPVEVAGGLNFANGIVLDEDNGQLFVSETMGSRVLRFRMNTVKGQLSERSVAVEISHPDNLELDERGRLWIASPVRSEISVFDPQAGTVQSVYRIATPESERLIAEIEASLERGESWLDSLAPGLWEPGPGLVTGMIVPEGDGPAYVTGLGDALVRIDN